MGLNGARVLGRFALVWDGASLEWQFRVFKPALVSHHGAGVGVCCPTRAHQPMPPNKNPRRWPYRQQGWPPTLATSREPTLPLHPSTPQANAPEYHRLERAQSLKDALRGKEVVEYPVVLVIPGSALADYRVIEDGASAGHPITS